MSLSFGTDGLRGPAGTPPLDPETLKQLGQAAALTLKPKQTVLIGQDTRQSAEWIKEAICSGFVSGGIDVFLGGILPTGALSVAVKQGHYDLGVMITASHNPASDNGIKFLNAEGQKPSDALQDSILKKFGLPTNRPTGTIHLLSDAAEPWRSSLPCPNLNGLKILLDCANGAAAEHAPAILEALGAELILKGCRPNGHNINDNCGALFPPTDLRGGDMAICFDGDADRVLMVDPNGVLDGDDMLWILKDHCPGPLVGTIMSNGGLEEVLSERLVRASVGDRHVSKLMKETKATMGAEPSGHVLFSDGLPTGDGLYTALRILDSVGFPPFNRSWTRWPCYQKNITFSSSRIPIENFSTPNKARSDGQRVIVRYSGTEPKLRILVEGLNAEKWIKEIYTECEMQLK